MKDILEETHGVMVYQEQVMRILNRLGGIELANAYTCIKAISKKKLPIIAKFREQFIDGAAEQGLTKKEADELFGMIEKFAGYGFNKSHSTAYALIAYMTAYLKAHYPVEFMAALLSGDIPGRNFKRKDSLVEHLEDCQRMEIEVVPPDVNRRDGDFTVADGKICFGLSAIKGCGGRRAEAIVAARQAGRPVPQTSSTSASGSIRDAVNRATIETLIKAGAFDSLGAQAVAVAGRASIGRMQAGAAAAGRSPQRPEGPVRRRRRGRSRSGRRRPARRARVGRTRTSWPSEKEVLGFYLSSHPLAEHEKTLATYCSHTTVEAARARRTAPK